MSGKTTKLLSGTSVLQGLGAAGRAPETRVTSAVHRRPLPLTCVDCQPWDDSEPVTELEKGLSKLSLICNLPFCAMTTDFPVNCLYTHAQSPGTLQTTD